MPVLDLFPVLESYTTSPISREQYSGDQRGKGMIGSGAGSSVCNGKQMLSCAVQVIPCGNFNEKQESSWSLRSHLLSPPRRRPGAKHKQNVFKVTCACIQRCPGTLSGHHYAWMTNLTMCFFYLLYIYFLMDTPIAKTTSSSPSDWSSSVCGAAKYYLTFDFFHDK